MLESGSTRLRAPMAADLDVLVALRNDLETQLALIARPRPNSPDGVRMWLDRVAADQASILFVVADSSDDGAVGYIQLTHIDAVDGSAELGICLSRPARGRGYGAASLHLIADYGASVFGLRKIVLRVLRENLPAIALYESAGYRVVGVLERQTYQALAFKDVVIMETFIERSSPSPA